jgi:hypothetical protein
MNNETTNKLDKFLGGQVNTNKGTALASLARTATNSTTDFANYGHQGLIVIFDVTAVHASGSDIKCKIEGKDTVSGKYYTILESASVTTVSTNIYRVNPQLTAGANLIAKDMMPTDFRFTMTHANANATTYSVGYMLI